MIRVASAKKIVWLPDGEKEYVDDWDETGVHESPIETEMDRLLRNAFEANTVVIPQCEIGPYRVDFALRITRPYDMAVIVIECDGEQFHRDFFKDIQRDKELKRLGVHKIIRATGSDIFSRTAETMKRIKDAVVSYGGAIK
ncbi:endonuclease domain-containing protein [Labrys sp. La1]|uniref:endonuclease domain-containing protein n=1 Tax=Labrys sp. La1 TaxID=3404917 RepID=UPI003EBF9BDC